MVDRRRFDGADRDPRRLPGRRAEAGLLRPAARAQRRLLPRARRRHRRVGRPPAAGRRGGRDPRAGDLLARGAAAAAFAQAAGAGRPPRQDDRFRRLQGPGDRRGDGPLGLPRGPGRADGRVDARLPPERGAGGRPATGGGDAGQPRLPAARQHAGDPRLRQDRRAGRRSRARLGDAGAGLGAGGLAATRGGRRVHPRRQQGAVLRGVRTC